MKTSECAKTVGVSIDTLRYYERIGLIAPIKEGYNRAYSEHDIEILKAIIILKSTGMSLNDIKIIINMETQGADFKILKSLLENQIQEINKQEHTLKQSKVILMKSLNKVLEVLK